MKTSAAPGSSRRLLPKCLSALLLCLCCAACSRDPAQTPGASVNPPILTMMPTGENSTGLSFLSNELDRYRKTTGVQVRTLSAYDSVDTRLRLLQQIFAKKSLEPNICEIDNIWPGLLADDLLDLKPYLGDELTAIDKGLLA